jgi:site-specific recombinase XerD
MSINYNDVTTKISKIYSKMDFKGYHAHYLRHTFACPLLKKYKDIYGLNKILKASFSHNNRTILWTSRILKGYIAP